MTIDATRAALLGLALTSAAACSRPTQPTEATPAPAPSVASSLVLQAPRTTSPSIAIHNLDAELDDELRRMGLGQLDQAYRRVGDLLKRASYEGRVADLIAADDLSAKLLTEHPDDRAAHLARASALGGVHAFAESAREVDAAERLAAGEDIRHARAANLIAVGREDEAIPLLSDVRTPTELTMRAAVDARIGQPEEAEKLFEAARASGGSMSPFGVAWVDFERARAFELAGDRGRARAYLEEAATVLPCYAHAVVHLAALEPPDRALDRLKVVEATSDDPDVLAAEGDVLRMLGRPAEAATATERARRRYEDVLARLPLAYADHAATFYLGMGRDPARALKLARTNAENRPTAEAVELWLTAAEAAGSKDETCEASTRARALRHPSPALLARAGAHPGECP